ncbi:alpha-1,2-fucosyltransferase [Larkinella bovis]|uniref:Alpha-1,2-fucosyltransferase n=1 Tax=Larkinella bovis TaxID=683041 RepID=A0ABW0IBU5_9BACT
MVISSLMGGLGNQLFQYAFGLRMAHERQTELKLSTVILESRLLARLRKYTLRPYELDVFDLQTPLTSFSETTTGFLKAVAGYRGSVFLPENSNVQSRLTTIPSSAPVVFCWGYWQSETWFQPIAPALRDKLRFQKPLSVASQRYADAIHRAATPVFIHVRRGDYITNPNAREVHGFAGETYYRNAIAHLREQLEGIHFFAFSDDMAWVKARLGPVLKTVTYVEGNTGTDSWQDLYLMSLCPHAIVANSSFSWWGAWLHSAPKRTVVAPRQWFASSVPSARIVVPQQWTLL